MMNMKVDPLNHYRLQGATVDELLGTCGILPHWAVTASPEGDNFKEAMIKNYSFYFGPMEGGTLHPDGSYEYPGDPVLYPILSFEHPDINDKLFIYEYGMVGAYANDGTTWMTRMD